MRAGTARFHGISNKFGSSAKSVGAFWFRQSAKGLIQGDFHAMKCPKTKGFSGGQFCLGIESLHDSAGELPFGPEPVE